MQVGLLVIWFGIAYLLTNGRSTIHDPRPLAIEFFGAVVLTVLIYLNFQTVRELQGIMASIVIAGLFSSLVSVEYFIATGGNGLRFGTFGNTGATYNTVSYLLAGAAMAGPIAATMNKRGKQTIAIFYRLMLLGLLVFGILLTGTRGGVLAIGVAVIVGHVVLNRSRFGKTSQTVLASIVFLTCVVALSKTGVVNRIFFDTKEFRNLLGYAKYARGDMFLHAIQNIFSDVLTPWFGIGVGQYRFQGINRVADYPHNLFLDLAVNAGIPAALLFGILIWRLLRSLVRMSRDHRDPLRRHLAFQMLGVCVVSLIGGSICFQFTANLQLWVMIGAWGSLEAQRLRAARSNSRRRPSPTQPRRLPDQPRVSQTDTSRLGGRRWEGTQSRQATKHG